MSVTDFVVNGFKKRRSMEHNSLTHGSGGKATPDRGDTDPRTWNQAVSGARYLVHSGVSIVNTFTQVYLEDQLHVHYFFNDDGTLKTVTEDTSDEAEDNPQAEAIAAAAMPANTASSLKTSSPAPVPEAGTRSEEPHSSNAITPEMAEPVSDAPVVEDTNRRPAPISTTSQPTAAGGERGWKALSPTDSQAAVPERNILGARTSVRGTYYPNLPAFVEKFIAHVFSHKQSRTSFFRWVPDWWRYPSLYVPLDAIWRNYEMARLKPDAMMIWYMQAGSLLDKIFNKDRGIVASLIGQDAIASTNPGDPLPCQRPPEDWRIRVLEQLDWRDPQPNPVAGNSGKDPNGYVIRQPETPPLVDEDGDEYNPREQTVSPIVFDTVDDDTHDEE
ncbi:hypothetical protein A200_01329 [Parascardovia denticolens IPLA 20019]|nr:hypothetical protein A200_01329 [Parascardovia denticolens IPLA 20019]